MNGLAAAPVYFERQYCEKYKFILHTNRFLGRDEQFLKGWEVSFVAQSRYMAPYVASSWYDQTNNKHTSNARNSYLSIGVRNRHRHYSLEDDNTPEG